VNNVVKTDVQREEWVTFPRQLRNALCVSLLQEALPAVQEEHRNLLQEMRAIQDDEHELRKEALNIKFKIEQIDSHISTHQSKIKYWQKEVSKLFSS